MKCNQYTPLKQRFLNSFKADKNGCWIWTAASTKRPSGERRPVINKDGKSKPAHRISYELFKGQIPNGLFVCHRCDVTLCVNPEHLFLGTSKQNIQDAVSKGRCFFQKNPEGFKAMCVAANRARQAKKLARNAIQEIENVEGEA